MHRVGQVKKLFENDKCKTLQKSTLARKRNDGGNAFDADKVEIIIGKNIDLSLEVIL